ncbi:MAG: type II CRISPR-associated endonuclease Cas1 [Rickettsiales bacterium]|jgi:CRISPR-associated protein Cas1|nr:type II CRISPR-associated endonuclease Cas1 [Rickettsiales bacterium]
MQDNIIEIANDGRRLSLDRGFLCVDDRMAAKKVPLENILSVVISANQATISKNIINAICDSGGGFILCDDKYIPNAMILPYSNHWLGAPRVRSQIAASIPLNKNLWKKIIEEKIANQARALAALRPESPDIAKLNILARNVKSNDGENCEGVAAKIYFKALFGDSFIRDRNQVGINRLLNYAYIIIRSAVARSIAGNGLLPQLGIKHCNQMDQLPLADDLMEPFRPAADTLVFAMTESGAPELTPETKRKLAGLLVAPVEGLAGTMTMSDGIYEFVGTLEKSYRDKAVRLAFPKLRF